MLALPAGPAPAPRRQLLVGTALGCAAAAMLVGGLLAIYMRLRMSAVNAVDPETGLTLEWLPDGVKVPEVAANNMLISFLAIAVFAQWAVYAARRDQKAFTGLALALTALVGLAVLNAQVYIYQQMEVPVGDTYGTLFYGVTGTYVVLLIGGLVFSVVTIFRYLGGRTREREIVAAHALYWYIVAVVFTAVWLIVYVGK